MFLQDRDTESSLRSEKTSVYKKIPIAFCIRFQVKFYKFYVVYLSFFCTQSENNNIKKKKRFLVFFFYLK